MFEGALEGLMVYLYGGVMKFEHGWMVRYLHVYDLCVVTLSQDKFPCFNEDN